MQTRCKPGDLAVIINEVPSCAANIGRIVKVDGPPRINDRGQVTWLIMPVTDEPYSVNDDLTGEFLRFMGPDDNDLEHPDGWMLPVRIDDEDESVEDVTAFDQEREVVTCR